MSQPVCKFCGCAYSGEEDKYEPIEGGNAVKVIRPSWVVLEDKMGKALKPTPILSVCDCPCHWRHQYNKDVYIQAYKEIFGGEK